MAGEARVLASNPSHFAENAGSLCGQPGKVGIDRMWQVEQIEPQYHTDHQPPIVARRECAP